MRKVLLVALVLLTTGCSTIARAVVESPAFIAAYHDAIAQRYYNQHQYRKARVEYEIALRVRPQDVQAHVGRALTYVWTRDYASAIVDFNRAEWVLPADSRYDGERAAINDFRGFARYNTQDWNGAIRDYTESIRLKPNVGTYINREEACSGRLQ